MAEIYTNLPRKSEDNLDKTKKQLTEDLRPKSSTTPVNTMP